jgi:ribonuclease HI/exonuclease III
MISRHTVHHSRTTPNPTNNFKCLQWNARGLTKAKLEEFRQFLSLVKPEIILLSETHWKKSFYVKFKAYHILKKNRPNRSGGGVAILINKQLSFTPLHLTPHDTVEAIGVSILSRSNSKIDFISAYVPKGDCEMADVAEIFNRPNPVVIGGDFNGHHDVWESNATANTAGKTIFETILNSQDICLITPTDLGTRIDPASGKISTIDLTMTSSELASSATISIGPSLGSDHLPIILTLNTTPARISRQPPKWIINENKWGDWNHLIDTALIELKFSEIQNPEAATTAFMTGLNGANEKCFKKSNPSRARNSEPSRPWWNAECNTLVKNARIALRNWCKSPTSLHLRTEWKKAEALKKRHIIKAKKEAWSSFISNLGPQDQPRLWTFTKSMLGKGSNLSPDGPLISNNSTTINSPKEKADLFLDRFSSVYPANLPTNDHFHATINSSITSTTHNILNDPITPEELERSLPKSKSKAVGADLVNNAMLNNLSPKNRTHLLHLFNTLFTKSHVPAQWKESIVLPLLKPGKKAEDPSSYRPISLTSCLCKTMERVIATRLHWFLESKNKINKEQAGFRRGCSTTDHIVQLETDIKLGFSRKQSTVAVFLDISKAYDSVWTQGLLYKTAKLGITGQTLAWIKEFLTDRSMCVRIGDQTSDHKTVENGVPQGAVLSPILFNIMLIDFPTHPLPVKTRIFADDVTIYAKTKLPADAEVTIQPALNKIYQWGRRWKLNFSPDKSTVVVFNRSYKPGADPLLFINGHRIASQATHKFLGVWLDQKLLWKTHIDHVRTHCMNLKKLFTIIANAKLGPPVKTLTLLYKSLVRSKVDYGLIAYGNASRTNIEKINVVCRAIIRTILGAKQSTPTQILYAESGTEPLADRKSWLTSKYIINLGHKPFNPTYDTALAIFQNPGTYPTRSTPCLAEQMVLIQQLGIDAFPAIPPWPTHYRYPPPSTQPPCKTVWFPGTKKASMADKNHTKLLFNSLLQSLPIGTLLSYTDGSKSTNPSTTTCAVVIPELNIEKAWTLETESSIFSAELQAIKQALKTIYDLDHCPTAATIFSDSSAAIKAIISSNQPTNEAIPEIRELLYSLKSSGTQTTLGWIPSHTGIEGNEQADKLASSQCTNDSGTQLNNSLSPNEKITIYKKHWGNSHIQSLKLCKKKTIAMKTSLKTIPWHQHNDRKVAVCLHRLRSGHHYLNSFHHRINPEADPSCRYGCEAIENPQHILISCPKNEPFRHKLRQMFLANQLEFNYETMLGLNTSIDAKTQFKIRDLTAKFLTKTSLTSIV